MFKRFFLLPLFAGVIMAGCTRSEKREFEKSISFEKNLLNTKNLELVCQLSEDSILLKNILNFTILNDSSFVVVDGRNAYLYDISGNFKKQFGNSGQARGEMISPSLVYATSDFVYIWCSTLRKFLIFDHDTNFMRELSGFKGFVKKFVVDSSNETIYIFSSGFFNELENKTTDVIDVYNITKESSKKFGERCSEDEVLSVFDNSGGLYVEANRLIYLHPGNMIIYDHDLNSDKSVRYKIDDKAFHTTKLTSSIRDVIQNRSKLTVYLNKNSIVKGLFKNNDQFIIASEIGQNDFDERGRITSTQKRKVKLYIFDSSFNPNRTILYDYINSPNIVIKSNYMYFLTLNINNDDQIFTLNRISLSE